MPRRRMMMQSKGFGSDYIKKGLVFWLDGIDKGATDGSWVDLINGIQYVGNATPIENGFSFDGRQKLSYDGNPFELMNYSNTNFTVEICAETIEKYQCFFRLGWNSNIRHSCALWRVITQTWNDYEFGGADISKVKDCVHTRANVNFSTLSINYNRASINQEYKPVANSDMYDAYSEESTIGGLKDNTYRHFFDGIIHAIRIYNRPLSIEEMLHNQRIDNARFHLGL